MWWLLASKIGYAIFGAICYHVVKLMRKREKFKTFFYFHGLLVREYFPNTTKYPGRGRALLEDIYEALVGLSMLDNLEEGSKDVENLSLALEILLEK